MFFKNRKHLRRSALSSNQLNTCGFIDQRLREKKSAHTGASAHTCGSVYTIY